MATIGNGNLTLADWAKRVDPKGQIDVIVEMLSEQNEIIDDMVVIEGNLPTGHRSSVRTGLPTVAFRKMNAGVIPSKSRTVQVDNTAGTLEGFSTVDRRIADLGGQRAAFRMTEDTAFMESMNQTFADTLFFGDTDIDPEKFLGFAPRFNSLSDENADNIIDAGGTGSDNTSIWLIIWSDSKVHGFFPNGSKAGMSFEDMGEDIATDSAGGEFVILRSHYMWDFGLNVKDWRFVVRIANIDVSDLNKGATGSSADIIDLMTQALEIPPSLQGGRPVFYVNRTIRSVLRRQISNKATVNLLMDTAGAKHVMSFDSVPVRRVDQLLNTEAQIT